MELANISKKNLSGAWLQARNNDVYLRSLGLNFKFGFDGGGEPTEVSYDQWRASASANQLSYVVQTPVLLAAAQSTGASIISDPYLLGGMHGDEPDQNNSNRVQPAELRRAYDAFKAVFPSSPVFCNFDAWQIRGKMAGWNKYDYAEAAKGVDILSFDLHIANTGGYVGGIADLSSVAAYVSSLGKPFIAMVEASDEDLKADPFWGSSSLPHQSPLGAPTPALMHQEFDAVYKTSGCVGVFFFLHKIGKGFEAYLNVPPDNETAIHSISSQLTVSPVDKQATVVSQLAGSLSTEVNNLVNLIKGV